MRTYLGKGGELLKGMRFNEKLECVIQRALRRLHGRMKYAYLRGELKNYLDKIAPKKDDAKQAKELAEKNNALLQELLKQQKQ